MLRFSIFALVSFWMAATGTAGVGVSPGDEVPAYFPGGLANASGSVGCIRTLAGGVEAVDLASGRRLWKSDPPSRALLVGSASTFILEERGSRLQLAAYEPRNGRRIKMWPCNVERPAWALLAEPRGGRSWTTFDARARRSGDVVEIGYIAQEHIVTGIAPPAGPEAKGVIRVELSSGEVEHRPGDTLPPPPLVEPAPSRGYQPLRFHARAASPALMMGGPPPDVQGTLISGDWRVVFEKAPDRRGVIVRRWRASTGAEEPPVEIAAETDLIWPTLDRGHIALRRASQQSTFDVYSLASGARITTLVQPIDIAVVNGRVLWTTRAGRDAIALIATDAIRGRALWRKTVWRDPPAGEPIP